VFDDATGYFVVAITLVCLIYEGLSVEVSGVFRCIFPNTLDWKKESAHVGLAGEFPEFGQPRYEALSAHQTPKRFLRCSRAGLRDAVSATYLAQRDDLSRPLTRIDWRAADTRRQIVACVLRRRRLRSLKLSSRNRGLA
jgi:hypothetical protein